MRSLLTILIFVPSIAFAQWRSPPLDNTGLGRAGLCLQLRYTDGTISAKSCANASFGWDWFTAAGAQILSLNGGASTLGVDKLTALTTTSLSLSGGVAAATDYGLLFYNSTAQNAGKKLFAFRATAASTDLMTWDSTAGLSADTHSPLTAATALTFRGTAGSGNSNFIFNTTTAVTDATQVIVVQKNGVSAGSWTAGGTITALAKHSTVNANETFGSWGSFATGVVATGTSFDGPFRSTSTVRYGNVTCSSQVAGVGGTVGIVVRVQNITDASTLCTCTLGACTTAAHVPLSCACNTFNLAAKNYTVQLDPTAVTGTDCATDPTGMICSVELMQ